MWIAARVQHLRVQRFVRGSRVLFTGPTNLFLAKFSLKIDLTSLFTYLKIILLQCFQFSVVRGIQTNLKLLNNEKHWHMRERERERERTSCHWWSAQKVSANGLGRENNQCRWFVSILHHLPTLTAPMTFKVYLIIEY